MDSSATAAITPVRLQADGRAQVSDALARAFQDDPLYVPIFPDAEERRRSLRWLFGAVVDYTYARGEVYTTSEANGAACWLPPGETEVTLWRMLRTGMGLMRAVMRFNKDARRAFMQMLSEMGALQKQLMKRPHWHLWALGVAPECQGQGVGAALLRPVLAQADDSGMPCYLETQSTRNVAFYERRGFAVVHGERVLEDRARVWVMVREARARDARPGEARPR
jgi:ribosomal protein S18 acetylase RimI-like enzyme